MKSIGFIGVGELALYTIKGIRAGGYRDRILLSPRNAEKAAFLRDNHNCEIASSNQSVVDDSDCVIIATRPDDCLEALSRLSFRPGQVVLSVVAGIETTQLQAVLHDQVELVRAMPVSSAEAGASPTLVYPAQPFVMELFDYCGKSIAVDDEAYFSQGSVLACVYCWFFTLFATLIEATKGPELPAPLSAALVMGMASGAAQLALSDNNRSPQEIAESIATEGTYSKLGLDLLKQERAFLPWAAACELLQSKLVSGD